jgi:hypothetical protein
MRMVLIGMLALVVTAAGAQSTQLTPAWSGQVIDMRTEVLKWQDRPLPRLRPEELEALRNYEPSRCMLVYVTPGGLGYRICDADDE